MIRPNRRSPVATLLTPLRRQRLHEGLIAQLKALIASARMEPGEKLPAERELAGRLGVSRVVVREALRSLKQAGLVEIRPGRGGGAFVAHRPHKPLSDAVLDLYAQGRLTLRHFYEARRGIEGAGVRLAAARATARDVAALRAINRRLLDDAGDPSSLRRHNAAFHVAVAEISGNPLIVLLVQSLMDLLDQVAPLAMQSSSFMRATYRRHQAIIEALRRRDARRAERLMAVDTEFTAKLRPGGRQTDGGRR
jgi:GntR family transcriptional repressor for pyruvate dehydrogenase complex